MVTNVEPPSQFVKLFQLATTINKMDLFETGSTEHDSHFAMFHWMEKWLRNNEIDFSIVKHTIQAPLNKMTYQKDQSLICFEFANTTWHPYYGFEALNSWIWEHHEKNPKPVKEVVALHEVKYWIESLAGKLLNLENIQEDYWYKRYESAWNWLNKTPVDQTQSYCAQLPVLAGTRQRGFDFDADFRGIPLSDPNDSDVYAKKDACEFYLMDGSIINGDPIEVRRKSYLDEDFSKLSERSSYHPERGTETTDDDFYMSRWSEKYITYFVNLCDLSQQEGTSIVFGQQYVVHPGEISRFKASIKLDLESVEVQEALLKLVCAQSAIRGAYLSVSNDTQSLFTNEKGLSALSVTIPGISTYDHLVITEEVLNDVSNAPRELMDEVGYQQLFDVLGRIQLENRLQNEMMPSQSPKPMLSEPRF